MKKLLLPSLLVLSIGTSIKAQTFEYLDANNIKARIDTSGLLFKDPVSGDPGFEVPKGSGNHAINGSHILIGGQTGSSVLTLAASDLNFLHDFRPGPLTIDGTAMPITGPEWNRVWKIHVNDINYHIAHYASSGYVPPPIIAEWPAYGNPLYSSLLAHCAPFFDANGNGIYDPVNGDYPVIRGTQAVFQVFNDMKVHPSLSSPIGIEVTAMAYVFDCPADSALTNTVFVHYVLINRGTQTLYNTYIGINNELMLGNATDNYTGCDVTRGMYYAYNGDNVDEADVASNNYGFTLPVQGVTVLRGPYQDNDMLANGFQSNYAAAIANGDIPYEGIGLGYGDTLVDNEQMGLRKFMSYNSAFSAMASPVNGIEFYNGLSGLWSDGSQPVWGAEGYPGFPGVSTTPVDYMYYYDTDSSLWASRGVTVASDWREDLHANTRAGRKTIGSCGPFKLLPGDYNEVDIAYTFARDYSVIGNPLAALPLLQQRVDSIRSYFITGNTPCGDFIFNSLLETPASENISFSVYPNPSTGLVLINTNLVENGVVNVFDMLGHTITSKVISPGETISTLDLSAMAKGIYMVQIHTGKNVSSKKLVLK